MDFSIYGNLVRPMAEIRQDFKKWFSVSRKGVKNEAFPIQFLAFKIFILIVFQNQHFCQIFKKSCFSIFIDVCLCAINSLQ